MVHSENQSRKYNILQKKYVILILAKKGYVRSLTERRGEYGEFTTNAFYIDEII